MAFDCLLHDLLIAKYTAFVFDYVDTKLSFEQKKKLKLITLTAPLLALYLEFLKVQN